MSLYMETRKWCPVCGKTQPKDLNYCMSHKGVLLLKVFSYEPGKVSIPVPSQYDIEHDDFDLDQGLSPQFMVDTFRGQLSQETGDWVEEIKALGEGESDRVVALMAKELKRRIKARRRHG